MTEGIGIRVDGSAAAGAIAVALAAKAGAPRVLFDLLGAALVASTTQRFVEGKGPDGNPWPPSLRARASGGKTLVDSARLQQPITHIASDAQVEVGTNVLYAAIQQLGGTIAPKEEGGRLRFKIGPRTVFATSVTLPARPFLGIDGDDEAEIAAAVADWLLPSTGSGPVAAAQGASGAA